MGVRVVISCCWLFNGYIVGVEGMNLSVDSELGGWLEILKAPATDEPQMSFVGARSFGSHPI